VTSSEVKIPYPCDDFIKNADEVLFRGITVRAEPQTIYRWLCQLRIAPYSYDWIDNLGRKSPEKLTPGLDDLKIGQTVMTIFNLIDFKPDSYLTIRIKKKFSGIRWLPIRSSLILFVQQIKTSVDCLSNTPKGFLDY
jgi:hypothetical protein